VVSASCAYNTTVVERATRNKFSFFILTFDF
jgi:hypothetical protein